MKYDRQTIKQALHEYLDEVEGTIEAAMPSSQIDRKSVAYLKLALYKELDEQKCEEKFCFSLPGEKDTAFNNVVVLSDYRLKKREPIEIW